jgi:hypothetical protein
MPHDGSLASLVEEWIVAQIAALGEIPAENVEVYPGSHSPSGDRTIEEFAANRTPYVAVLFEGDKWIELEEGQAAYAPTYGIYLVVLNPRPGTSRFGEAGPPVVPGTNLLRDLFRNALHDKFPNLAANGYHTDHTEFQGVSLVFERRDAFMLRAEVVVRESPTA